MIERRTCAVCKVPKPLTTEFFHKAGARGLKNTCKPCWNAKCRERHANNLELVRAQCRVNVARYRTNHPDRVISSRWTTNLAKYHLTPTQFRIMMIKQKGACAICKRPLSKAHPGGRKLNIDHDTSCCPEPGTSCGKCVRSLLCSRCNGFLAQVEKGGILPATLRYMEEWASKLHR